MAINGIETPKKSSKDGTDYSDLQAEAILSDPISLLATEMLSQQVQAEYELAKKHLEGKMAGWTKRFKLLNNQRRQENKVGEPLMFTVFQTVLASLYNDEMAAIFKGRIEAGANTAENLDLMVENDFDLMKMGEINYDWDFDTCFFGRGLVTFVGFDRDFLHPIPEVIDPLTWLRDPYAVSVNGRSSSGTNAMMYGGREMYMERAAMEQNESFYNLEALEKSAKQNRREITTVDSLAFEAKRARAEAQNKQFDFTVESGVGINNTKHRILQWFTHWEGKKVVTYWTEDFELIRFHKLRDAEGNPLRHWEIYDRPLYPTAHDWDGTSIPDLTEDKQRMMSVIENLLAEGFKGVVYPSYIYDKTKIKNRRELDFGFNKFIASQGNAQGAVVPLQKADLNAVMADYILRTLDNSAQKATATPEIQQGTISKEERTLGELNKVTASVDNRNSLSLKVFGWSEREFWRGYYAQYKRHFDEHIDEKVIRLEGAFGDEWRTFTRENIISTVDPDVKVISVARAEADRIRKFQAFSNTLAIALQDPTANKRYMTKKLMHLSGMKLREINKMFPPTPEERVIMEENEILSQNRLASEDGRINVAVLPEDNDTLHLEIHSLATDTPALRAHIKSHKTNIRMKVKNPELFPNLQQPSQGLQPGEQSGVTNNNINSTQISAPGASERQTTLGI